MITSSKMQRIDLSDIENVFDEKPIFLQIPKTGSTSLISLLKASLGDEKVLSAKLTAGNIGCVGTSLDDGTDSSNAIIRDLLHKLSSSQIISVMAPFSFHKLLGLKGKQYFSMVREPVERCISLWYFSYGEKYHTDEFNKILNDKSNFSFYNEQVRLFSGSRDFCMTSEHLEKAKENILRHFFYVGLQENWDISVQKIFGFLGIPIPHGSPKLRSRRTEQKGKIDSSLRESLSACNAYDIKLYNWLAGNR